MESFLSRLLSAAPRRSARALAERRPRRLPLEVEVLEDRLTPATITVTNALDTIATGDGVSLREAIRSIDQGSNLNSDVVAVGTYGVRDTINFAIPGATPAVKTLSLSSALDAITRPVTINGYSQLSGATQATANTLANADNAALLIQLDGTSAGTGVNGLVLGAGSGGSTLEGLDITNFRADSNGNGGVGILVQSNGNKIAGNFIGIDPTGTTRMPNGGDGIRILGASNNIIGTTSPADRNVVSGNSLDGIHLVGQATAPATGNLVVDNFVGIAADGKSSVGNRTESAPAPGTAEGNNLFGIEISGGTFNTIGGTAAGSRNVVGLNNDGIGVDSGGQNNTIQGNFSGVAADGVTPAGNRMHGIVLQSDGASGNVPNEPGVSFNLIGGTTVNSGNLVAANGSGGIVVFGNPVSASGQPNVGNAIEGNSIFQNGRTSPTTLLGIDLSNGSPSPTDDGLTPNDSRGHGTAADPNNFQNFPVLASVAADASGNTLVTGTLKGTANLTYRIEFFASDPDPLGGSAEGQQFLGFANVTTDGSGNASFSATLNGSVANGRLVTATATDPLGNTSEFSAGLTALAAAPPPAPTPTPTPPPPTPTPTPPAPVLPPVSVSVALTPLGQFLDVVDARGVLTQYDPAGTHVLGSGVRSASVAISPFGEVLDVVTAGGVLTQFDAAGAHTLSSGIQSASVAMGPLGEVLDTITTTGLLTQFDIAGAHSLGSGFLSASLAYAPSGLVLDAVTNDGVLTQYDSNGAHKLMDGVLSASAAFTTTPTATTVPAILRMSRGPVFTSMEVLDVISANGNLTQIRASGSVVLNKLF